MPVGDLSGTSSGAGPFWRIRLDGFSRTEAEKQQVEGRELNFL